MIYVKENSFVDLETLYIVSLISIKKQFNYIFPSFGLYDNYETIINKINKENPDEVYIEHLFGKFDDDIIVYTNYGAKFIAEGVKVPIYVPEIVHIFDPLYGSSIKLIYKRI